MTGIDRDGVIAILTGLASETADVEGAADRILALVRPVEGIVLSRDEAAHAAWAIRQVRGWPKDEPDVIGWAEYNRALAARLEASS